jgi:signal transduction histidine kinase
MKLHFPPVLRFILGLLVVIGLTMGMFYMSMHPPMGDVRLMALFLAVTALISGLAGFVSYRLGWLERMPSLRMALLGGYALASLLTFFNVWVTARLMFTSYHDLQLATVLLVFAGGIAMLLGYFLSNAVTRRVAALKDAARQIARGNLAARARAEGHDEIAELGNAFNQMAEQLQAVDQQKRELDSLRRDLVAWASHDLQTPLTAIRVQVEALADGLVDDPVTIQRYLRTTQRQVKDLSLLIDDLFQVAQMDAGGLILQRQSCSLSDLLSDTLESFSALARERGVSLAVSIARGVDPANLDAPRIGRVLNNLIGNALRYTPSGGQVDVSARREGSKVVLEIADTGEGIDPKDLPHVFERFYRGEKSRNRGTGGAGLGLAIAHGIVQAHGGDIRVESQSGSGTRFTIAIPA